MKKINIYILLTLFLCSFAACSDFFDVENRSILSDEEVFGSEDGVNSALSNLYSRLRDPQGLSVERMTDWDEAIIGTETDNRGDNGSGYFTYWDYGLIRSTNMFLENLEKYGSPILESKRKYYAAEARFIRAWIYFDLVKNMGGVPFIENTFDYKVGSNPADYQVARSKEDAIYQFIGDELDAIKDDLDIRVQNRVMTTRATKGAALALRSRTMLFAGSIAKYTSNRGDLSLTLPNGETGIPFARSRYFYEEALKSFQELELMGLYGLYNDGVNKGDNFYEAIIKKNYNKEIIFMKDYDGRNIENNFAHLTIPRSLRGSTTGGSLVNPTLNLVESFQKMNGTTEKFKTKVGAETIDNLNDKVIPADSYVVYDTPDEIFKDRDPRLYGTVLLPGSTFRGQLLSLYAGLAVYDGGNYELKQIGNMDELVGGDNSSIMYGDEYLTGFDGPHASSNNTTRTGFLLRKYVDNKDGTEVQGRSDVAYIRLRYSEALLNAAEAAYELGDSPTALDYINQVRNRAGGVGFELSTITSIADVRYERMAELSFEEHRFYDVRRWRTGDILFDGNWGTSTSVMYALWPYKIYRPGHSDHGKYIFRRMVAPKKTYPVKFLLQNYYGGIPSDALNNNKLLIKNPYQN